jgi:hypothetical protein
MSLKFLKNDAIVKIQLGSGFIQRVQQIVVYILQDISEEKINEYKQLLIDKKDVTEPWMEHVTTLSVLLREIEERADEQGLSYETNEDQIGSLTTEEES